MAGNFLGDQEAAGSALAGSHPRPGYPFNFVDSSEAIGDNFSDFRQCYIFAAANQDALVYCFFRLLSHRF
jgi:hypothetical protein